MDSRNSSSKARFCGAPSGRRSTVFTTVVRTIATRWLSSWSRRSSCSGMLGREGFGAVSTGSSTTSSEPSQGHRSGPGDLDLVAYSLRKYVRLALKGHPTILLLLFVPGDLVLVETELGEELRALRPEALAARRARVPRVSPSEGAAAGSTRSETRQSPGARGGARLRHEVCDARGPARLPGARAHHHGMARRSPCPSRNARGSWQLGPARERGTRQSRKSRMSERRLAAALESTPLRAEPDRTAVDGFLVDAYRRAWGWSES